MESINAPEQAIQQIIICFAFLNLIFVLSLNRGQSFSKAFGLVFALPLVLYAASFVNPGRDYYTLFRSYLDLIMLVAVFIMALIPYWNFAGNALLIAVYVFLVLFLFQADILWPSYLFSSFNLGVINVLLTLLTVIILLKRIENNVLLLIVGLLILGAVQSVHLFIPQISSVLPDLGRICAYILFFIYIYRDTMQPYLTKTKKAEKVLKDLQKTVDYELRKKLAEIERNNEHLRTSMLKDPLVDALNRKAIFDYLNKAIEKPDAKFTILLFDLDDFKKINDMEGHLAGDRVLKKIAKIAKDNIRSIDVLGRYGGDEFLIILPGTTVEEALRVAERFRQQAKAQSGSTVSIGIASYPADGKTVQELINVADKGMYQAKNKGKNAVTHYKPKIKVT